MLLHWLRVSEETLVALVDVVAGGARRCFVVGGSASDFFLIAPSLFGVLDFLGLEGDCLLGLLGVVLLLFIGLEPLGVSLPLSLPGNFDDLFLGLADLDLCIDLDLRALVISLGLSSFVGLNAPLARRRFLGVVTSEKTLASFTGLNVPLARPRQAPCEVVSMISTLFLMSSLSDVSSDAVDASEYKAELSPSNTSLSGSQPQSSSIAPL
jgi:hypothetical protein